MFNQAQVARLSNISPEHQSFYDPRHLAHHRALLRALRKRDPRAAGAVVRKHFQSLGLMLEFVTRSRREAGLQSPPGERMETVTPLAQVLPLSRARRPEAAGDSGADFLSQRPIMIAAPMQPRLAVSCADNRRLACSAVAAGQRPGRCEVRAFMPSNDVWKPCPELPLARP